MIHPSWIKRGLAATETSVTYTMLERSPSSSSSASSPSILDSLDSTLRTGRNRGRWEVQVLETGEEGLRRKFEGRRQDVVMAPTTHRQRCTAHDRRRGASSLWFLYGKSPSPPRGSGRYDGWAPFGRLLACARWLWLRDSLGHAHHVCVKDDRSGERGCGHLRVGCFLLRDSPPRGLREPKLGYPTLPRALLE